MAGQVARVMWKKKKTRFFFFCFLGTIGHISIFYYIVFTITIARTITRTRESTIVCTNTSRRDVFQHFFFFFFLIFERRLRYSLRSNLPRTFDAVCTKKYNDVGGGDDDDLFKKRAFEQLVGWFGCIL